MKTSAYIVLKIARFRWWGDEQRWISAHVATVNMTSFTQGDNDTVKIPGQ